MKSLQALLAAITALVATTTMVSADTVTCTSKTLKCTDNHGMKQVVENYRQYVNIYGTLASCDNTASCNGFKAAAGTSPICKTLHLGPYFAQLDGVSVTGWLGQYDFFVCKVDETTAGKCSCS